MESRIKTRFPTDRSGRKAWPFFFVGQNSYLTAVSEIEENMRVTPLNRHFGQMHYFTIRDMPVMQYQGERNWPPHWVSPNDGPRLEGEIGILKDAFVDVREPRKCFLFMDHNEHGYIATLQFDDKLFCPLFVQMLKRNFGKTIKQVGDLIIVDESNNAAPLG